jgi:hypothetical protein
MDNGQRWKAGHYIGSGGIISNPPDRPAGRQVAHRVGSHQTSAKSFILLLRFMLLSAPLRGHHASNMGRADALRRKWGNESNERWAQGRVCIGA